MRIRIDLSYDGSGYQGSQIQSYTNNTIMNHFYKALLSLNITAKITAAGRTDKGVHATHQVFHVDLPPFWSDTQKLHTLLNHKLPKDIHVNTITPVSHNFHARYSVKRRVYRYILSDKPSNPFEQKYVTFVDDTLNLTLLKKAIKIFEGEHDFNYFKKSGSDAKTTIRTMYKTRAYRHQNKIILYFEANGFLYSQIRLMVGFLLKINSSKLTCKALQEQLTCKKIHNTKPAPSNGLYLAKIHYQ